MAGSIELPKYGIDESLYQPGTFYLIENAYKNDKTFRIVNKNIIQIWGYQLTLEERKFIQSYFQL